MKEKSNLSTESCPARLHEYEQANEWWRILSQIRRRDIALVTTAQGAVVAVLKEDLLQLSLWQFLLSTIAFLLAVAGLNNERRLYCYLKTIRARAVEIERDFNMTLLTKAAEAARRLRFSLGSSLTFACYYCVSAVSWLAIWIANAFP